MISRGLRRFYAHREEGGRYYLLSAHLARVGAEAARAAAHVSGRELFLATLVAGFAHDFGKYTSAFQQYLRPELAYTFLNADSEGRGWRQSVVAQRDKQHAFLSAIWAAYLAAVSGLPEPWPLLSFFAVCRHHQHLDDPGAHIVRARDLQDFSTIHPWLAEGLQVIERQVKDLASRTTAVANSLAVAWRRLFRWAARSGPLPAFGRDRVWWEEHLKRFLAGWREHYSLLHPMWRRYRREPNLSTYLFQVFVFSAVIDSDKLHAARIVAEERPEVPARAVESYINLPTSPVQRQRQEATTPQARALLEIRDRIYRSAGAAAAHAPLEPPSIFTLTAPTGSGKTLCALNAALLMRERLKEKRKIAPRIIYALPFTSIINQTYAVLTDVFRRSVSGYAENPALYLLKHHHLAEIESAVADATEEASLEKRLLLVESWQSEIVVTTFVQLLHTLIGYENRMLKKFNRLAGSIVIMDEVQNIPAEYWPLVEEALLTASSELGLHLILMTATHPAWFAGVNRLELAGKQEEIRRLFGQLRRVVLQVDLKPRTVEEAVSAFIDAYRPDRSYLVVLNTIRSSCNFYRLLKDRLETRAPMFYLSAGIIPVDREERLEAIRRSLAAKENPVVVSTQVVEAGVDLDFDVVWRDLAPVDAVVQVAGRCNRHGFKTEPGEVHLIYLEDGRGSLAARVYGHVHISTAKEVFGNSLRLEEPEFLPVVENFFAKIRERKSLEKSRNIVYAMKTLRFAPTGREEPAENYVKDFQLIENIPGYIPVFAMVNEEAQQIWARYEEGVLRERDVKRRQGQWLALKHSFYRYLLSVPPRVILDAGVREGGGIIPLPPELLAQVYDRETGFHLVEEGAFIF